MNSDSIRRYNVIGSRRVSNYWWAFIIGVGGFGFLLTGLSSYLQFNLLPIIHSEKILFFPQGLVMCFYGVLGILFSFYLVLTIFFSVGEGFNEFNKELGMVRIFRWGFPGKNRRIDLSYEMDDVKAIRVELKEGINPKRTIYLCIKGQRQIPLTRIGQPLTLEEIEIQAAELAQFLQKDLLLN
uniref:photosystem I assembly protein Ycf4 n=1 Tax=Gayralia brasiliensis TaxID=1286870 RepID=UPI002410EA44|nr:photosystem I assembly protein Ycf4 [Gayralia brasiliensis]YP_010733736.1 photosystem I assembly protein Ycf4 [Monostroma nitidum]WEG92933.1 photosystem I assembly protein Ycf4 [Gayralia brasiliensis]WEG93007.1 photosystem I assembly protein Ycf4 [Monostroma nitidum]